MNEIIKHRNDRDPKRSYYIRLAYLFGIDVEINEVYANQFLQNSIVCGFKEGAAWLGDMYREGIRVPKNDKKAVYWYAIYLNAIRAFDPSEINIEEIINVCRTKEDRR